MASKLRNTVAVAGIVAVHPSIWPTAVVVARRMVPTRWWSRPPFLPLPSRDYLRFRRETYYGSGTAPFEPQDVLKYLRWVRTWDSSGEG